jgi:hypothetical protein
MPSATAVTPYNMPSATAVTPYNMSSATAVTSYTTPSAITVTSCVPSHLKEKCLTTEKRKEKLSQKRKEGARPRSNYEYWRYETRN